MHSKGKSSKLLADKLCVLTDPSVILGSFSNYLVTKSSVPVMVARKRLRKHTKYKRPVVRLANNLSSPVKSLEKARID